MSVFRPAFHGIWKFRGKIKVLDNKSGWLHNKILQAFVLAVFLFAHVPSVMAQTPPASPDAIVAMAQGGNPQLAAQMLQQATGITDVAQITGIISNIQGALTSKETMINIVKGLIESKIPGDIAKLLTGIPNIGQLNANQLLDALSKSGIDKLLADALKGIKLTDVLKIAQLDKLTDILETIGGSEIMGLLKGGLTQKIAEMIAKAFPQLAALLGGIPGIKALLDGLLPGGGGNDPDPGPSGGCNCQNIVKHHDSIRGHMTNKRKEHENWLVTEFFTKHVAPALMLMAEQLTVAGMQQVQIIGAFFDATHQLESQRLLQQLTAVAHKDYQPSEGLCTFGTSVRSLAGSERGSDLAQMAVAARGMQRQLNQGDNLAGAAESGIADRNSRMKMFIEKFCSKNDNDKTLDDLCKDSTATAEQKNKDIDYTRAVENKLTLDLDFYKAGNLNPSKDEENIFALGANLYAHDVLPYVDKNELGKRGVDKEFTAEQHLMDLRAIAAKRSVAQNTFAAITGMKAAGTPEAQPYLYKMVAELGVPETDLEKLLGKNPSYFAQMEILTKKALQNPVFYTELYDKPVNVDRKGATLQAIGLMQDRDIYKSLIRSEAILSVLLDSMLAKEYDRITLDIEKLGRANNTQSTAAGGGP